MLAAAGQAFQELFTPPFRAVLWKCIGFTVGLLALFIIGLEWTFGHFVQLPGWIETTVEWLGGLALVVGSIFLVPPVTSLIASLYLDDIAAEVESTVYPSDPPGRPLDALPAVGLALKFFFVVLAVNILALFLLLIPGINVIAFYLGNGYLLGREYFELAAMRYVSGAEARVLFQRNLPMVYLAGVVISGFVAVPVLNLLTPLFATAFMVRVCRRIRSIGSGAPR